MVFENPALTCANELPKHSEATPSGCLSGEKLLSGIFQKPCVGFGRNGSRCKQARFEVDVIGSAAVPLAVSLLTSGFPRCGVASFLVDSFLRVYEKDLLCVRRIFRDATTLQMRGGKLAQRHPLATRHAQESNQHCLTF